MNFTRFGAGAVSGGTLDANVLKPRLVNVRCIGATTFKEYRGAVERDRALDVFKSSKSQSPRMQTRSRSSGLKGEYERHHGVRYTAGSYLRRWTSRSVISRFAPSR